MLRRVGLHDARLSSPAWGRALLLLLLAGCGILGLASAAGSEDVPPFREIRHMGLGRIVQVWPLRVSECPNGETDLLVLSTRGGPPQQRKVVTWMPCGSALRPGDPAIRELEMAADVVLVDVARVPGRVGPQLLRVSAAGIRVESLEEPSRVPPLDFGVPGGLPLPPRPRELGRVEIVADWHSQGRPVALVPALTGGWLVDLESGEARRLPMPMFADYRTRQPFLPAMVWKWMISESRWPTLARADDNGDGRMDLFALSRWETWIYHAGPDGLPGEPSRKLAFVPFDEESERRHEATGLSYFAEDLDGDGRADLLLSMAAGGLMEGRSKAQVHLGGSPGVALSADPAASREMTGGFSAVHLVDLDGDGRSEILEMTIEFGVIQIVAALLTGNTKITLRVLTLDPDAPDGFRIIFEDDLKFALDLASSRIEGLVPTLGDWNGDGIQDLHVSGSSSVRFRLGARPGDGPLFGKATGRQPLPLPSGQSRVADLDGDRLDDLIAFDDTSSDAPLIVLENRGLLPGTGPRLRAADTRRTDPALAP